MEAEEYGSGLCPSDCEVLLTKDSYTCLCFSIFPGFQVSVGGTSVPQKENQINDVKSLFRTPHGPWMIVSIDFISECTNDFI